LRILGIDPGSLRLGYGAIECSGAGASTVRYVECGVISASASKGRHARLAEIGRGLRDVLAEIRPDAVAMEDVFYGVNVQSTLALGEARGVAMFVAAELGLSITGYPPATVKQAADIDPFGETAVPSTQRRTIEVIRGTQKTTQTFEIPRKSGLSDWSVDNRGDAIK